MMGYIAKGKFTEGFDNEKIDTNTAWNTCREILTDEIDDTEFPEFAIENLDELFSHIINGNLNIRIHRDITGEMWVGVG